MKDPYETLGLTKTATASEIKGAFKKLARKHHPDLHPDDKGAEARFKDISVANDLLGDPEKRRRFDAGRLQAIVDRAHVVEADARSLAANADKPHRHNDGSRVAGRRRAARTMPPADGLE